MFIDEKGRLFGRINILDFSIIVILIGALGFMVPKILNSKTTNPMFNKSETIVTGIWIETIPEFAANTIQKGDSVRDAVKNVTLGRVTDIVIKDSVIYAADDKGQQVVSSKPGYKSIQVTLEGPGILSENAATFDNADEFVGKTVEFRFGRVAGWGYISSLKKKE